MAEFFGRYSSPFPNFMAVMNAKTIAIIFALDGIMKPIAQTVHYLTQRRRDGPKGGAKAVMPGCSVIFGKHKRLSGSRLNRVDHG